MAIVKHMLIDYSIHIFYYFVAAILLFCLMWVWPQVRNSYPKWDQPKILFFPGSRGVRPSYFLYVQYWQDAGLRTRDVLTISYTHLSMSSTHPSMSSTHPSMSSTHLSMSSTHPSMSYTHSWYWYSDLSTSIVLSFLQSCETIPLTQVFFIFFYF